MSILLPSVSTFQVPLFPVSVVVAFAPSAVEEVTPNTAISPTKRAIITNKPTRPNRDNIYDLLRSGY
jgi:hypothetical protein